MAGLVIVGASYAGVAAAAAARAAGYAEPIRIVGDEPHLPYHRPPLSKPAKPGGEELLRGEGFYAANDIVLEAGSRVTGISLRDRSVSLARGSLTFDHLLLATGARARLPPLPGAQLDGVHTLRSREDAARIQADLAAASEIVIVGGGFIGLELAASFRSAGKRVTVLEPQERLLARSCMPALSSYLAELHRAHGVGLRLGMGARALLGSGRVEAVLCDDGQRIGAELVVLATGAVPNDELAAPLGLTAQGGGVEVGIDGETAEAAIYAAGDCAVYAHPFVGRPLRLESVQNATDQGKRAGARIAGRAAEAAAAPWFWSDQYATKLQMVGIASLADRCVTRGDVGSGSFSLFCFRDERLVAVESVNAPLDHVMARRLLAARVPVTPDQARDVGYALGELLRRP